MQISDQQQETMPDPGPESETLADLYGFLALAMRYPEPSFLDDEYLAALVEILGQMGLVDEQNEIRHLMDSDPALLDNLQQEYTRLFVNNIPRTIAPPYASIYMDDDYSLQGKYTEKIRDYYRSCSFDITDTNVPADHIQYQLAFLAALAQEKMFVQEQEFLTSLFRPWFERFVEAVYTEVEHPFYRVSLQLIDILTQEEQ